MSGTLMAAQGISGNGTSWFEAFKTIQEGVQRGRGIG